MVAAASRGVWNRYGVVTVPPVRNVSFTNHPSGAAICRTQNCRPSLAPPAAVPVTTNEQSPSASDTQVKAGVPPSSASYSPSRTPASGATEVSPFRSPPVLTVTTEVLAVGAGTARGSGPSARSRTPAPGVPAPSTTAMARTHPAAARRRPGSLLRTIDSLGSVERAGMPIIAA